MLVGRAAIRCVRTEGAMRAHDVKPDAKRKRERDEGHREVVQRRGRAQSEWRTVAHEAPDCEEGEPVSA